MPEREEFWHSGIARKEEFFYLPGPILRDGIGRYHVMHVLAVGNQKGGVAKTTSAAALAVILSREGRAVHLVDMDPQANLTAAFGQTDPEGLLYQAMKNRGPLPVVRLGENLTLTPSSIDLARGESEFLGEPGREYMLKTCLEKTDIAEGAVVIIDCPPSLAVLATNCFTAAEGLIVPVKPGGFELRAIAQLTEVVRVLKERVNRQLQIVGAILTDCQARRAITPQIETEVAQFYRVLGQVRSDSKLLYATTEGGMLDLKRSSALEDYESVVNRLKEELEWLRSE
jgi:chromosome partitioning protein